MMNVIIFDEFPMIDDTNSIIFVNSNFVELKPMLDMCRIHNKTLMVVFHDIKIEEAKEEE